MHTSYRSSAFFDLLLQNRKQLAIVAFELLLKGFAHVIIPVTEKQKLEQVISVFAERLKESDAFDLVWSDKVGYVLLDIAPDYDYVDTARRVDTAEELCRLMLEDTALDVLLLTENEHSMETADPLERAEIVRRWQPYFEQLPEYEYLREELTSEWP